MEKGVLWLVKFRDDCGDLDTVWSTREAAREYVRGEIERLKPLDQIWNYIVTEDCGPWDVFFEEGASVADPIISITMISFNQKPYC